MNRGSGLKSLFASALTAIVLFTVSVRDVHYLFAHHDEIHEHCNDAHLHANDEHTSCAVCKFDVSFFTDGIEQPKLPLAETHVAPDFLSYQTPILISTVTANSLRGPPVQA